MKKKSLNQKIILIIISVIFIFIIIISLDKICSTYQKKKDRNEIANSREWKKKIIEKEDGWYYFMSNEKVMDENGDYIYYIRMDGCNIKYQTMDSNYIIYYDETNSENNSKILSNPPNLATSYYSKNGIKTEQEELEEINSLIENSYWNSKIENDDLKSLNFVNFESSDIIYLWNNLYDMNYSNEEGNYDNLGLCYIISEEEDSDYYQVGVVLNYGKIEVVKIDYIDEDGEYLTDKVENGTISSLEKKKYENITKIENEILSNDSFNLDNKYDNLKSDANYRDLFELLSEISTDE